MKVQKGSPAEKAGVQKNDCLMQINGHPVRDIIDYRFHSADEVVCCVFSRSKDQKKFEYCFEGDDDPGLEFDPVRFCGCGNHCIFCFIDQNPGGLRRSLYFKDEDYRLSFLFGNYVTLTRVDVSDLKRIVKQRLSPLYISIHATNPEIRKTMLGLKKDDHLLKKIEYLAEHRIEMHGQIVLCPGINDGSVLEETQKTLSQYYPALRTMALVPVGLTQYRKDLPELHLYDSKTSDEVIRQVKRYQKKYIKKFNEPVYYLADEFYLMAHQSLPELAHYGDLWQVENGIGMTRSFLEDFGNTQKRFPQKLEQEKRYLIVTGMLAGPVLEQYIMPAFHSITNCHAQLVMVPNRFYGESVTVSGLLTGQDILFMLKDQQEHGTVLIPSNCINTEGVFLDNMTPSKLSAESDREICILNDFAELWGYQI